MLVLRQDISGVGGKGELVSISVLGPNQITTCTFGCTSSRESDNNQRLIVEGVVGIAAATQ